MSNKIANRARKACCPRCHHTGYSESVALDGRPLFTCGQCAHQWTRGKDGGEYRKETK